MIDLCISQDQIRGLIVDKIITLSQRTLFHGDSVNIFTLNSVRIHKFV